MPKPKRNPPFHSRQFLILTIFLGLWVLAVVARLFHLQVFQYKNFAEQARRQQERTVEVSPVRGNIYDRHRRPLAMSVEVESVFAVPAEVGEPGPPARLLAPVLSMQRSVIESKLAGDNAFAWIKRKVTAREADRVRQMNLKGIYFQKETKRFYPKRELAAHVLGHVGMDDQGLAGLELKYEEQIRGTPGRLLIERDALRRRVSSKGSPPQPGRDLVLTLDENIQFIAERELDAVMAVSRAATGTVIVQDPRSGEILALANRPTFNPNRYASASAEAHRDLAISGIYEPGSTFKIITMSGALDSGLARPEERMDCQMGSINIAGHTIRDHTAFGILTVSEAFEKSSDVCSIKLALRLGNAQFYEYIRRFGFGMPTGIELPGEARGLTKPPERWWKASIGAMAMGQEIGVTPLQLAAAASVVANDGVWVRPRILRQGPSSRRSGRPSGVKDSNSALPVVQASLGGASAPPANFGATPDAAENMRRVISPATAARMQRMMAEAVRAGTGKSASPKGYSAGGKTGTAQKLDPATGTYSRTQYVASFVGFAPLDDPLFTILVVLDSPRGRYHGGDIAAPVFGRIAEQILAYRNLPGTGPPPSFERAARGRIVSTKTETEEFLGESSNAPFVQPVGFAVAGGAEADSAGTIVPNFLGLSLRAVTAQAVAQNLRVQLIGSGVAYEQSPLPGVLLPEGASVLVKFRIGSAAQSSPSVFSQPGPTGAGKTAQPASASPQRSVPTAAAGLPAASG